MTVAYAHLNDLAKLDRDAVEALLDQFEQAWDERRWPAFAKQQLPSLSEPLRKAALVESIKIDLEHRWQSGKRVTVESYLKACPDAAGSKPFFEELARAEHDVRTEFGGAAGLAPMEEWLPKRLAELTRFVQALASPQADSKETTSQVQTLSPAQPQAPAKSDAIPEKVGRYQIIERIGQGAMGSVYLARDPEFDRKVAIKVPKLQPDDPPEVLERFYREAKAAATLEHPNLCPVHDVGRIDGVPYLVMAFIEGKTLRDVLKGNKLPSPRDAAAIVRKLALAMHEAHAKGVIHRDLKPANVKLNARREPVILDFGLARREKSEDVRLTQSGAIIGTPAYMPPEQVKGDVAAMGPPSDIYSLGVILYELLTGKLPFMAPNIPVMIAHILTQKAPPPSKHRPDLDPELEAICIKATAKKIGDRYRSMKEFADALTGYLKGLQQSLQAAPVVPASPAAPGQPVAPSSPGSAAEIFAEMAAGAYVDQPIVQSPPRKRRIVPIWAWAVLALLPLGIGLAGTIIYIETRDGTIKIELNDPKAEVKIKVDGSIDVTNLDEPLHLKPGPHGLEVTGKNFETVTRQFTVKRGDNPAVRVELVGKGQLAAKEPPKKPSTNPNPDPAPQPEATPSSSPIGEIHSLVGHTDTVTCLAFSHDGTRLLTGSQDKSLRLWNVDKGELIKVLDGHEGDVSTISFAPDGQRAVSSGNDKVWLWDLKGLRLLKSMQGHNSVVRAVSFTPDGRSVISTADGFAKGPSCALWNLETGVISSALDGHRGPLFPVTISSDGKRALTGGYDGVVAVWDLEQGKILRRFADHGTPLNTVSLARDGRTAATASGWGTGHVAYVWDVESGKVLLRLDNVVHVRIHPDGKLVLGMHFRGKVAHVWSVPDGKLVNTLGGHRGEVSAIAISADGRLAATGSKDQTVRIWKLQMEAASPEPKNATAKAPFTWPADALREGRIKAPDLSKAKVHFDGGKLRAVGERNYATGVPGTGKYCNFACEFVLRVAATEGSGVNFHPGADSVLGVEVVPKQGLRVTSRPDGSQPVLIEHLAIKPSDQFNTVLVIIRGKRAEIYINSVAVCDPIVLSEGVTEHSPLAPAWLVRSETGTVEFQRVTIYSAEGLPTPEERVKVITP